METISEERREEDLLTLMQWSPETILKVLKLADDVKAHPERYHDALAHKTLAMIFQKTSTRTRISFEAGMAQLGGHAIYLDWRTTNLTKGRLDEEIRCIERYCDVIMARVYKHEDVVAMADAAEVPVINALCDKFHPCQILADLQTIKEKKGVWKGLKIAFVGDGNNVCNSLIVGGTKVGAEVCVGTAEGYEPLQQVVEHARKYGEVEVVYDPVEAVQDADVVYTDVWVSMGQEEEYEKRMKAFGERYQVNSKLMGHAKDDAIFMHCLPAMVGKEVTEEVLYSKHSVIFDQAENRMHAQKALLLKLLGKV
jgi:ornithine carbamoyltransferase